MQATDINVTYMWRGNDNFIFLYDDQHRCEAIQVAAKWAGDPDISFTWYDAARVSQEIRSGKPQEHRRW